MKYKDDCTRPPRPCEPLCPTRHQASCRTGHTVAIFNTVYEQYSE